MSKVSSLPVIRLRGVRHNNLKNFDLDLPLHRLIVITGLSGSGKSSLAFDTLFAEGQRRYIETFSPYARQFFDRMDKPQVDSIEGIPPAIAIEQRNSVKTTRSTVGTMTEICDHMKLLWSHVAQLYCRQCGRPVRKDSPKQIWEAVLAADDNTSDVLITFTLPLSDKIPLAESLALISRQGYQRLLHGDTILRVDEALATLEQAKPAALVILQDRLKPATANRARFIEACEQAYHFGKGKVTLYRWQEKPVAPLHFSNRFHCAPCDLEYREPSPALFSFNHPLGACPMCRGFGRTITIDYQIAVPDTSKTLAEGVVKPWLTGHGLESQEDLTRFCKKRKVPMNVPFRDLPADIQRWVIDGDPDYGIDEDHKWPKLWYGVKGYFRWLESKAYKMHVRVLLSRYRAYVPCPACRGQRFQPDSLLFKLPLPNTAATSIDANAPASSPSLPERRRGLGRGGQQSLTSDADVAKSAITLSDFYTLAIRDAFALVTQLAEQYQPKATDPLGLVLNEVRSRLGYLVEVGLGYLTLDRPTRSLSGGETERVNLTSCLGTRLVNTLFVLDEPSVGLHPRDTDRLVRILQRLRDQGNTVVVVEHEASVMRAADQIVDIGPGHGESGGQIVFQGPFAEALKSKTSLTGQYLSGHKRVEIPSRRPITLSERGASILSLTHATLHNLQDVSVEIPLGRFIGITGVSGSGKTTLIREVLLPALEAKLKATGPALTESSADDDASDSSEETGEAQHASATVTGWEKLGRVVLVDQASLGKTPRSNPAVYIGAFEDIRDLFAQSELAKQRGLNSSAFSFNSGQGQCERCRGVGFEKIEMQFLSDVFIRCPECNGRRYRPHILEVKISSSSPSIIPLSENSAVRTSHSKFKDWSIADLLEATVDEVVQFLAGFADSRPAKRAGESLKLLQEVGLGYLRLGQPINTLSGGESQRLKLVRHLAEFTQAETAQAKPTLFLFDEPTTGLHFDDVRVLLNVFQRLVDAGHSVLVIEHNLDVIKCADWIIDLGPDAGDQGGRVIAQGTPEHLAAVPESHTGQALQSVLAVTR